MQTLQLEKMGLAPMTETEMQKVDGGVAGPGHEILEKAIYGVPYLIGFGVATAFKVVRNALN